MFKLSSVTVLSIFPGVDLFGRAFTSTGFCVVKGPDKIFNECISDFRTSPCVFKGVIGGPPCVDFSKLNRNPGKYSLSMLAEYLRVVEESRPEWWLLENVPGVPDLKIDGYSWQRFDLDLGWFSDHSRLRHFQFGHKDGLLLNTIKGTKGDIKGGAALANDNRSFAELRAIQGLTDDFDLESFNVEGKKRAVGNGVPIQMGEYLAQTIARQIYNCGGPRVEKSDGAPEYIRDQLKGNRCGCECGRNVYGRATYASATCRKRAQRKRAGSS